MFCSEVTVVDTLVFYWLGKSIMINCGEIMGMIDLCPFNSLK